MKLCYIKRLVLAFIVLPVGYSFGTIMSPEKRQEQIGQVRTLLSNQVETIDEGSLNAAPSPFIPSLGHIEEIESVVEEEEERLTEEQLLEALSEYVTPTGIFMFGGEFYLIFKEEKLKNGSELGITYYGKEYSVEIIEITGSTYRIRRGDTELQMKLK